jgi:hypothetical protein
MNDVEKKDVPEVAGGEASTLVAPDTAYPILPVPVEREPFVLIVPEQPLP